MLHCNVMKCNVMLCYVMTGHGPPTLAGSGADVGYEAAAAGLWLGGAHLTWVPPRPAHRGTAQRLGAHDAAHLALAHLVVHLGEARPRPVVCGERKGEKLLGGVMWGGGGSSTPLQYCSV